MADVSWTTHALSVQTSYAGLAGERFICLPGRPARSANPYFWNEHVAHPNMFVFGLACCTSQRKADCDLPAQAHPVRAPQKLCHKGGCRTSVSAISVSSAASASLGPAPGSPTCLALANALAPSAPLARAGLVRASASEMAANVASAAVGVPGSGLSATAAASPRTASAASLLRLHVRASSQVGVSSAMSVWASERRSSAARLMPASAPPEDA
eukprot:365228-Chlamydomonas_euryale.AAC.2